MYRVDPKASISLHAQAQLITSIEQRAPNELAPANNLADHAAELQVRHRYHKIRFFHGHGALSRVRIFAQRRKIESMRHGHWSEMHNIEFSCPAVSAQHRVELPNCIHRSIRPLRGQLQRFVMWAPFSPLRSLESLVLAEYGPQLA